MSGRPSSRRSAWLTPPCSCPSSRGWEATCRWPCRLDGPGAQVRLLEGVAAGDQRGQQGPRARDRVPRRRARGGRGDPRSDLLLRPQAEGPCVVAAAGLAQRASPARPPATSPRVDLSRDGRAAIVSPRRLNEDEVAALVQAADPRPSAPDLEQRVYRESEGLPLFVAEYLAARHAGYEEAGEMLPAEVRGLLDADWPVWATCRGRCSAPRRSLADPSTSTACGMPADGATRRPWLRSRRSSARASCGGSWTGPVYDFSHQQLARACL